MATIELKQIYKQFELDGWPTHQAGGETDPLPTAAEKMRIEVRGERKAGPFTIENLNLTIPNGHVMVILGPSGCGKSTLLKLIAGLMQPDAGEVHYDGVDVTDIPPGERKIGMVFQNYALYPQYSSKKNILSYFFFRKKTAELDQAAREKYQRTSELMGVGLEYLLDRKPGRLSGGEQQRVAIARCITRDPVLFLMDEPFSNLDAKLRERYRTHLKRLLKQFKITTVYVTHDQREALALADLIAIMNEGSIEQVGTPRDIYNRPNNMFVADFLYFDLETPAINLLDGGLVAKELEDVIVGVRSEDIVICPEDRPEAKQGTVVDIRPNPVKETMVVCVDLAGTEIQLRLPLDQGLSRQAPIRFRFEKYHLFSKNSGRRVRTHSESLL
jgi:ABC-type sugar transport system ATPase subunit